MSPSALPLPQAKEAAAAAREPTFLVVDDNPRDRRLVARALATLGPVREAGRGEEVMDLLAAQASTLVCLDLSLPETSGYAVCREIRRAKLPCLVLAISERLSVTDRAFAREVGADDVLEKPFKIRELNRRVDYLLRMSPFSAAGGEPAVSSRSP